MLGPDVLVAPVVEPGVMERDVRLPAGADWRDGWTGEVHAGGQTVTVPAPLDRPRFFVRRAAGDRSGWGFPGQARE